VFTGSQELKDDVITKLSQGEGDKKTSTNRPVEDWSIGQKSRESLSSTENQA
jgi:hypothetical protein